MSDLPVIRGPAGSELVKLDPLAQFLAGQLSERTRRAYQADLYHFFGSDHLSLEQIREVGFQDLVAYRNELAQQGYKRTTINRRLASLKAFFRMVTAAGFIDKNPADSALVRGYRLEENLTGKAIQQRALRQLVAEIEQEEDDLVRARDLAIVFVLIYGGLRRSEAANISWEDLTQDGAFHVLKLPETKTGVPQDVKLQAIVIHQIDLYRQALVAHGYPVQGKAFISLSRNQSHGCPLTDQSINLIVKKRALRAGVPQKITAHMFRHTCCTLAIEGGAKPQQVQAHLRHKDLKTTMRYYEHRERLTDNASDYIRIT
ncbi:MAG: tyrosine-type recombinase/integrase [Candidatus Latescibacteria bacterium]|nr:tyrosine-type recombinase/integrase [Candidatus Latescibacterota bacterium]